MTDATWQELNDYLLQRSKEICQDNQCTEEEHNCESYAYFSENGLLDLCSSDYFQGHSEPYAAIPLPWYGTASELEEEVNNEIEEEKAQRAD